MVGVLALEALEPGHGDKTTEPRPAFRGWDIEPLEAEGNIGLGRAPREESELLEDGGGGRLAASCPNTEARRQPCGRRRALVLPRYAATVRKRLAPSRSTRKRMGLPFSRLATASLSCSTLLAGWRFTSTMTSP